ncbi:CoA ester lyase [Georgenia sp. 10Sc9-8]|uniref:CoA ester lyase n=1 Tax=Georgenia halotolerans TaxID=3028317 RepID=A0ABT5TZS9_9MICO|nr:CoA ester lyase [Georgenia halotolerans]
MHRSYLYAPGSKQRILDKALVAGADAIVCDLEDAVALPDKASARAAVGALVREHAEEAECAVHVRVNRSGDGWSADDLAAVLHPGLEALRLPKCESAEPVRLLDVRITELERERGLPVGSVQLYPTIESAAGAVAARDLARSSPRVAALVFGPSDFVADLGLMGSSQFEATVLARSTLVLESRAARIGRPVDGAFTDLSDSDGLRQLALRVRDLGFGGKSAIHPRQLPVLHEVFTPTADEVERAERIIDSLDERTATAVVDGSFVDPAIVTQAQAVLRLAERTSRKATPRD